MTDFRSRLRQNYTRQTEEQQHLIKQSDTVRESITPQRNHWPQLREHLHKEAIPAIQELSDKATEAAAPTDLTASNQARTNLKHLTRVTWFHPKAARIRFKNLLYRLGIFSVRLVQLSILVGILYLIMQIIWRFA